MVGEHQLGRLDALVAQLLELGWDRQASLLRLRRRLLDQQAAHSAMGRERVRVGLDQRRHQSRAQPVGNPHLLAGDQVLVALSHGTRADRLHVRAALRLGHREGAAQLAGRHPGQEALPLLLGAVADDHVGDDEVRVDDAGDAHPSARQLADRERVGGQVESQAAVLLGDGEAEQPQLAHAFHDLVREDVVVLELRGHRDDLLLGELAHQQHHLALLVGEALQRQAHAGDSWLPTPAATPRATIDSAILRDASSIIWPSWMTAPSRSTWVACS